MLFSWGLWVIDSMGFHTGQLLPNQIPSYPGQVGSKWGLLEAGKATGRYQSHFTSSFTVKASMDFTLISKMLKNVVLNYSCSSGLFLLLLGTVFLNSNYKSLKWGAPGREEAASVTRGVERTWGSTKGTEINLEPFPATQQFYSDVRGFFNVTMWWGSVWRRALLSQQGWAVTAPPFMARWPHMLPPRRAGAEPELSMARARMETFLTLGPSCPL